MTAARFAIVVSQFNHEITTGLLDGALQRFAECGVDAAHVDTYPVPGAVEIPLIAQRLAQTHRYAAIVCLGAVIRGETSHYDYVCQQVSYGCQRVALDQRLPVIFGILTTENEAQAHARLGGAFGHKGKDAADTALAMVACLDAISLTS